RRRTFPVAVALLSRPGRSTPYSAPPCTPPAVPPLMTSSLPDTSATSADTTATVSFSGLLGAAAASFVTRLITAVRVASPSRVLARFELHMSWPRKDRSEERRVGKEGRYRRSRWRTRRGEKE